MFENLAVQQYEALEKVLADYVYKGALQSRILVNGFQVKIAAAVKGTQKALKSVRNDGK